MSIKSLGKRLARGFVQATDLPPALRQVESRLAQVERSTRSVDTGTQHLLAIRYRELASDDTRLDLGEVEFRNYSQNGEDGILWYLFALIGTTGKRCVEICAGNGTECNTANLILHHGWTGLLVDGDEANVAHGRQFYKTHPDTFVFPPTFVRHWLTAENVNELLTSNGVTGEIDLLSLDLDGVDYWIWKAIDAISPRVVVAEVQVLWGSEFSRTVPYHPEFKTEYVNGFGVYSGASLPAFVKLARQKGYRLVGTQRYGFNAFFLRDDVGKENFPEVPAEACLTHPFCQWAARELRPLVQHKPWEDV